jgi:hypothetical protein
MGSFLAIGNAMHVPAGFVWAAIESVLVKRKVDLLTMRRSFTGICSAAETVLQVMYGLAPNPVIATVYYGAIDAFFTGHTSGAWSNYLEVGAEDTATLNATINTIASSLAIIVPYLGFWLRRVTGSWTAQIMVSVGVRQSSPRVPSIAPAGQPLREPSCRESGHEPGRDVTARWLRPRITCTGYPC